MVKKQKRVSKKNKSSWRKHCHLDGLEDLPENGYISDVTNFENVPDEQLFVVDRSRQKDTKFKTLKERRESYAKTVPNCYKIIEERSNIPDPITKRNVVKIKEKKLNVKKIKKALELKAKNRAKNQKKSLKNKFTDLWLSDTVVTKIDKKLDLKNECVSKEFEIRNKINSNKLKKVFKRPLTSILPAVETPHPGMSYNPSLKDHLNLLNIVDEKLQRIEIEKKHLHRTVTALAPNVSSEKLEAIHLEEMSQGLSIVEKEIEDDSGNESDYKAVNPPVVNRKKDLKKRRKESERRKLARLKILELKERQKLNQINKLKKITAEINQRERVLEKRKEKRQKKKLKRQLESVKRLGSVKYCELIPDYNRPQDINGSLRCIKLEGSLLMDCYNQLQKRNMLKPSKKYFKKTAKMKSFVHADDKLTSDEEFLNAT